MTLAAALKATFSHRDTAFPVAGLPDALTAAFCANPQRQSQWLGFVGNVGSASAPNSLTALTVELLRFLQPLLVALAEGRPFVASWHPGGPWEP